MKYVWLSNVSVSEQEESSADVKVQWEEQQKLVRQLKDMIREREKSLAEKDKEVKELNVKLSRQKLQAKSKLASMNRQLQDAERAGGEALERVSVIILWLSFPVLNNRVSQTLWASHLSAVLTCFERFFTLLYIALDIYF